jgi:hypothetical protein
MLCRQFWFGCLAVVAFVLTSPTAEAQSRNVRTGPNSNYNVPQLTLSRPTLTFSTGIGGLSPITNPVFPDLLSEDALEVLDAHNWARQQTLLCLMYLRARKTEILAGQDAFYNQAFGRFYDRSNPFAGSYTVDESHFNQVLNTFSTMRNLLEGPCFYSYGAAGQTGYGSIFGYDRGLRQWGYSTSSSRDHLDDIIRAYAANGNTTAPVFPPRRWDADDALERVDAPTDSFAQSIANRVDRAFFNEKLDIYGAANIADTQALGNSASQFLGNLFFYNPNSSDPDRVRGERVTLDAQGNVVGDPFQNGDIEFSFTQTGRLYQDYNLGSLGTALGFDGSAGRFNSNQPFTMADIDGDGVLDIEGTTNLPLLSFTRYPSSAFNAPRMRQFQMIMMSFAEFTTVLGDRRGGAFAGASGALRLLDPSGRALSVFGGSLDARSYALFTEMINGFGVTDPRRFPPAGKNVRAFNPAIPSS